MSYATQSVLWAAATDAAYAGRRAVHGLLGAAASDPLRLFAGKPSFIASRRALGRLAPAARVEALALGIEVQWRRATGVIRAAIASFRNIETFQAAAELQIGAANYELQRLIQDLAAAMPIPADGRELRAVLAEAAKATARQKKALAA